MISETMTTSSSGTKIMRRMFGTTRLSQGSMREAAQAATMMGKIEYE